MAKKTATNGRNGHSFHNGHVSLAREEYDAFMSREEQFGVLTADHAKVVNRNIEMVQTMNAQAQHLSNFELKVTHLERINALQGAILDAIKDPEKVASLEELSEFWKQWTVHTSNAVDARKLSREEVAKFEPDLFKTWRNWVNDRGRNDRTLSFAGSRAEREAALPATQAELQEHTIRRQREENHKLAQRVQQLEAELAAKQQEGAKP